MASPNGVDFGTVDSFDFKCGKGNAAKEWYPTPGSGIAQQDFPAAPANWKHVVEHVCGQKDAGMGVYFRGSIGNIPRWSWRYHQICTVIQRAEEEVTVDAGPDAAKAAADRPAVYMY